MHFFFLNSPPLHLANPCSPLLQQQDGPELVTSNGEPFHFLPTAPDVLFCKGSPSMKKVIMTVQPDVLQLASKRRQISTNVAPPARVSTKKRKIIARRIIKKTAQPSPSPSESNSNQATFPETSYLCIYILVDRNSIFRTQPKTSPVLKAQNNMNQLQLLMLWWRRVTNRPT